MTCTREIGLDWEDFALEYLISKGMRLLQRNARCRHLEVDLLMMQGDTLVFVEVRYRGPGPVRSWESLGPLKLGRLRRAVEGIIARRRFQGQVRVDMICIDAIESGADHLPEVDGDSTIIIRDHRIYSVRHILNALQW